MRQLLQGAVQLFVLPFLFQLFSVVIAPAGPAFKLGQVLAEPAFKLLPNQRHRCSGINLGLGDTGQLPTERGQQRTTLRANKSLKMIHLTTCAGDHAGADFDHFHFLQGPAAIIGSGFQVNYQPVRHVQLPLTASALKLERS